jgi:hypothetical protein
MLEIWVVDGREVFVFTYLVQNVGDIHPCPAQQRLE